MAKGRVHRKINLFFGFVIAGIMVGFSRLAVEIVPFLSGLIFSTIYFSPDNDIAPRAKNFVAKLLLYPYAFFFKHRGISHNFVFGTITRLAYGVILLLFVMFCLNKGGYTDFEISNYMKLALRVFSDFDYSLDGYRAFCWLFFGMFFSDLLHVIVDKLSSLIKRNWLY